MRGISSSIIVVIVVCLACWFLSTDSVSCNVVGAGLEQVNGYFSARNGLYQKRGAPVNFNPDIFGILNLKRDVSSAVSIVFSRHLWTIDTHLHKVVAYAAQLENPEKYLYSPPESDWKPADVTLSPAPTIRYCKGSLADSPYTNQEPTNIQLMLNTPVTTMLLGVIFYVAYYLYAYQVDISRVTISYANIADEKQYYRIFTSSFSHVDLMHLGFNTMSLYAMAQMEYVFGSSTYLYLSVALVVITQLIRQAVVFVMITYQGRQDLRAQSGLGYSCVLFAWIVVVCLRMKNYCPIFLLPSLCFDTWSFALPGTQIRLAFNVAPIVLLVFTKILIPRSSFLGHLSGIIIGFPLAWNALNWLSFPVLWSLCILGYMYVEELWVWGMAGYSNLSTVLFSEHLNEHELSVRNLWRVAFYSLALISVGGTVYLHGPTQLLQRGVLVFVLWSALQARYLMWLTSSQVVADKCVTVLTIALVLVPLMVLYDLASLAGTVGAWYLVLGCGLSAQYMSAHLVYLSAVVLLSTTCFCLMACSVQDVATMKAVLELLRVDKASVQKDLQMLGLGGARTEIFSGEANRLSASRSAVADGPHANSSDRAAAATAVDEAPAVRVFRNPNRIAAAKSSTINV